MWYPNDDPQRQWDEAIALAAEWIRVRGNVEGLHPLAGDWPSASSKVVRLERRLAR